MTEARDRLIEIVLDARRHGREPDTDELACALGDDGTVSPEVVEEVREYARLLGQLREPREERPRAELRAGDTLGDFEVVSELARGGAGVVYRARQRSLGDREVALKVVVVTAPDERALKRFRAEAMALAELHHPSLVEVHGFGVERDLAFLAMRLIDGASLAALLGTAKPEPSHEELRVRVRLGAQAAAALAVVHARGLIHRDVKPANVVLEGWGPGQPLTDATRAVLVDFGLVRATQVRGETLTLAGAGTPSYAAPEQILGEHLDARADVFSLGVTLHDLISGRSADARPRAAAGLEPLDRLVPGIDSDLAAVVARATDPDRRWRYADASALERDLVAWLDGRAVSARRSPLARRTVRWVASHPRAIVGTAVGALTAALLTLLAVAAAGWIDAAARVRSAFAAMDLPALATQAQRLPPPPLGGIGIPTDVLDAVRRLRAHDEEDPLIAILDARIARGANAALLAAATHVRVHGFEHQPLVDAYLLAHLDRALAGEDESLPFAFPLLARLMLERPARSPEELERDAALCTWIATDLERPRLGAEERLYLVSALGGCGGARDALQLAQQLFAHDAPDELRRLGLHAIERIVRRSLSCGFLEELSLDELEHQFGPLARERYASALEWPLGWTSGFEAGVRALAQALVLARRWRGEEAPLDDWFGADWETEIEAWSNWRLFHGLQLAAVAGHERAANLIEFGALGNWKADFAAQLLGWSAGALDRPELYAVARERFEALLATRKNEALGPRYRLQFDGHIEDAAAQTAGRSPHHDPHPDALLGASAHDQLSVTRSWNPPAATSAGFGFRRTQPAGAGGALLAVAIGSTMGDEALELVAPGRSELRLEFLLDESAAPDGLRVELRHLSAAQRALPWMGTSTLRLRIDGRRFCEDIELSFASSHPFVHVAGLASANGKTAVRHVLTIELLAGSTSPCWIHDVQVRLL